MTLTALGAAKDMDMNVLEGQEPLDMTEIFNTAVKNWIKNNPDKAAEIANEVVALVKEYLELQP
jgi:hypothetical protein